MEKKDKLSFHFKVIRFDMNSIPKNYAKMVRGKHQEVKVVTTENGNYVHRFHLNLFKENERIPLWYMESKMVHNVVNNKMIPPFKLGYMFLPSFNKNKAFREQVENTCSPI